MVEALGTTARSRLRRLPELAVEDVAELHRVLDEGIVAHVGIAEGRQPLVLPCAYARDDDRLLLHGSTGSRLLRSIAGGMSVCITVTLLDGVVYARSLFHSSMNYRSAMVFGRGRAVADDEKERALRVIADHLCRGGGRTPGRRHARSSRRRSWWRCRSRRRP